MLIATDLDGTFLAGDTDARQQLYQLISNDPDITLVFVTGRGLEAVLPILSDAAIPVPHYVIADVGATVVDGRTLQAVQPLQADIDALWPGERAVSEALQGIPGLQRQEVPQQRRCSYFCDSDAVTDELYRIANEQNCDLLYSADRYLDFLPRGVNKGSTLRRLVHDLGIDMNHVLVAGDTLNDLSMFEQGFRGVCVGESEAALLAATADRTRVLHSRRVGCAGILEALDFFRFIDRTLLLPPDSETMAPCGKSELVIVYHRLPYEEAIDDDGTILRRPHRSPNGIIPTLLSFFADGRKGSWIAWSSAHAGDARFETHTTVDREQYPGLRCARVELTTQDVDIFYKRFSKEAFWPTLHTFRNTCQSSSRNCARSQKVCKVGQKASFEKRL
jgi:hydroxymethylpyrimidine pyrophosphatase-like HAD family hydrolase